MNRIFIGLFLLGMSTVCFAGGQLNSNDVGLWISCNLNGTSRNDVVEHSSYAVTNISTYVSGPSGKAVHQSETSGSIGLSLVCATNDPTLINDSFTWMAKMKVADSPGSQFITFLTYVRCEFYSCRFCTHSLAFTDAQIWSQGSWVTSGGVDQEFTYNPVRTVQQTNAIFNKWALYCITYDSVTGIWIAYVNADVASIIYADPGSRLKHIGEEPFKFGILADPRDNYPYTFPGEIDGVYFYKRCLSKGEYLSKYQELMLGNSGTGE